MRPIITDVPWFMCPLDTLASDAKTAQPIQMLFGMWTWVGTENRLLGGSRNPPRERHNFQGAGICWLIVKHREYPALAKVVR